MDESIYQDCLGLSCIENNILGLAKYENFNITMLYYNSYVSLNSLYDYFFVQNCKYEFFNKIDRIQVTAQEINLIRFRNFQSSRVDDALTKLKSSHTYLLAEVRPEFLYKRFGAKTLRADHFILIVIESGKIYYINDWPRSSGTIDLSELQEFCTSRFIEIRFNTGIKADKSELLRLFYKGMSVSTKAFSMLYENDINLLRFRDFLGVYKTVRNRICQFLNNYYDIGQEVSSMNKLLERYYSLLEYYNLRSKYDPSKVRSIFDDILNIDKSLDELIEKKGADFIAL